MSGIISRGFYFWQLARTSFARSGAILLAGCWVSIFSGNAAFAQITPDATLGTEGSVVNPGTIDGVPVDLIEGGASRGANLFHSFEQFNVRDGQRVYFANPAAIENILSRVTGTDASDILGTLGVNGAANLFLLNPNGIIFGENARLDIKGSFVAATANSILFENGIEYSAINPEAPPLLTVTVPIGLQYGTSQSGEIVNQGNLIVGENFTLSADNLTLTGQLQAGGDLNLQAQNTVQVRDSVERPFIAAAGGTLLVEGNQGVDIFALNHPDSGFYSGGDMVLRSANTVGGDAHYWSGGNFRIENLDGSLGDLFSPGDPVIRASGDVSFLGYSGASLHILAGGQVNIPFGIIITGADTTDGLIENVILSDGTSVPINGKTQPTVDIRAGTTAFGDTGITGNGLFVPTPPNTNNSATNSDIIIGGGIAINAPEGIVLLTNQYKPNSSLSGGVIRVGEILNDDFSGGFSGNSGLVIIDSRGAIEVGRIDTSSFSGNGGLIHLLSDQGITFTGDVDSSARSISGMGGNIRITAQDKISLVNANSLIRSITTGDGQGGDIDINAKSLFLNNGARIFTLTTGEGQGGNLTINASELVELTGLDSDLQARTFGAGNAGDLTVTTGQLILEDGGSISTANSGTGEPGILRVNASELVELTGTSATGRASGFYSQSLGSGDGGDVFLSSRKFTSRCH